MIHFVEEVTRFDSPPEVLERVFQEDVGIEVKKHTYNV